MRLALFEISGMFFAVALDKVLHVLTGPHVFMLPLLRSCFAGVLVYKEQVVPLLACNLTTAGAEEKKTQPDFVLVCEAELGLLALPADRMVRITNVGEVDPEALQEGISEGRLFAMDGCDFRMLDLNQVMDDPEFTVCSLKD